MMTSSGSYRNGFGSRRRQSIIGGETERRACPYNPYLLEPHA